MEGFSQTSIGTRRKTIRSMTYQAAQPFCDRRAMCE